MELRHLRYFVAVAEELHFRKAAERLHIVQPALSKQIGVLEAELGVALFERDRRHVLLTEAGASFLDEALAVLARADGAKARAQAIGQGSVGSLSIALIQPALAELLPRVLRRYRRQYPNVQIRLTESPTSEVVDMTMNGLVQCAFVRLPFDVPEELECMPVDQQAVFVALPERHRLAKREAVEFADLKDEDFVLINRRAERALHDYYVTLCNQAGFSPRITHEVNSTWVALGVVASGLAIGFAPASMADHAGVRFLPIVPTPPQLTIGLVWHRGSEPPVLANLLAMRPWEDPK